MQASEERRLLLQTNTKRIVEQNETYGLKQVLSTDAQLHRKLLNVRANLTKVNRKLRRFKDHRFYEVWIRKQADWEKERAEIEITLKRRSEIK